MADIKTKARVTQMIMATRETSGKAKKGTIKTREYVARTVEVKDENPVEYTSNTVKNTSKEFLEDGGAVLEQGVHRTIKRFRNVKATKTARTITAGVDAKGMDTVFRTQTIRINMMQNVHRTKQAARAIKRALQVTVTALKTYVATTGIWGLVILLAVMVVIVICFAVYSVRQNTDGDVGWGNQLIVQSALSQVGNEGGRPYWSWYGFLHRVEWCACFVSWNADQCGYIESGAVPKFSYCKTGAEWFKSKEQWMEGLYIPLSGDIIFFDWEQDGHTDHVGIVESCDGEYVYTVEGNSNDMVRQRSYAIDSEVIYGYGVPIY